MAILGTLIKKGIRIRESLDQEISSPFDLQKLELKKLMMKCVNTQFGKAYGFKKILSSFKSDESNEFYRSYIKEVPIHDYNKIYNEWWHKMRDGQKNITWRGKIKYYALSSGTSEASSKYIPISKRMLKSIQTTGVRQILSLSNFELSDDVFTSGILMIGGSTHLNYNGKYFEGDLTGITASQIPFWFQHHYKPGKKISQERDWNQKLEEITENAKDWDIGIIVGVPAWIQILLEKIINKYGLSNIHEIWPNFEIYVHGGVSFEPYKKGFEKLLGRPVQYIETYLASEGFMAFQAKPNHKPMRLVLNNGIFFEFIPFTEDNFDSDGVIKPNAKTYMIHEIEENKDYALLITTCAGAWRYLIGDTVKLVSKQDSEIIITGRTKHFLSLCGEHLSIDNMNKAVKLVSEEMNVEVKEFTVAGIPEGSLFAHHWYIGSDSVVDSETFKIKLDERLKSLNDDYRVERIAALKDVYLDIVPTKTFYDWMEKRGKYGGQNKFPRVLKNDLLEDWKSFLTKELS
ncbi:MAG: GH3 auxin-responsive promoter family protein [Bacteroidota bacterium]